jgi:hypothetical protein
MPKGMFTQNLCVLLRSPVQIEQLEPLLRDFEVCAKREAMGEWEFSGPSLTVACLPAANGYVSIDIVNEPWPDGMGDPVQQPTLLGAWSMGFFGPFAFPGSLQRAGEQSWSWEGAKSCADAHQGFIRVRSSYAFGAADDAPIMPSEYAALPELEFLTRIADSLLELPEALCYFNPNGEVLRDRDGLRGILEFDRKNGIPAIDSWTNVRMFRLQADWLMMDIVGCRQLDFSDAEAVFRGDAYPCAEVASFLQNVALYLLQQGEIIRDGDTMDGPGGIRWQCRHRENSACDPPRDVLRWYPLDGFPIPREIEA